MKLNDTVESEVNKMKTVVVSGRTTHNHDCIADWESVLTAQCSWVKVDHFRKLLTFSPALLDQFFLCVSMLGT